MEQLALYIDKWYIVGALCTDDETRPIRLPNGEDRVWLFFHEDIDNDRVTYGRSHRSHYFNQELHYFGNVFEHITASDASFTLFKRPQRLRQIFRYANVLADLRVDFPEGVEVPVSLSFSPDISYAARHVFRELLPDAGFRVEEHVARIDHLALEATFWQVTFAGAGTYLVLNACNENLRYALYDRSDGLFVRRGESCLVGMGIDLRHRCLIEYVVDNINRREHLLRTPPELETEYLRQGQYVDRWLTRFSTGSKFVPVTIPDVSFSLDPFKTYTVQVLRNDIDQKTAIVVRDVVEQITRFVRESGLRHEQLTGLIFIGSPFTNSQFHSALLAHYNLPPERVVSYTDADLPSLVGAYAFIDRSQFRTETQDIAVRGRLELDRIRQVEEEKAHEAEAARQQAGREAEAEQRRKEEQNYRNALDQGYDAESRHDYEEMEQWFATALALRPDSDEARSKRDEAVRLRAEAVANAKAYADRMRQAQAAFAAEDWETARQKAEEALGFDPSSAEAARISRVSAEKIGRLKEFDHIIDRADLFLSEKRYGQALAELNRAALLGIGAKAIADRRTRIQQELAALRQQIAKLQKQYDAAFKAGRFDEAIELCNQLVDLDTEHRRKWEEQLTILRNAKTKVQELKELHDRLLKAIGEAIWKEDWAAVVAQCRKFLTHFTDEKVKQDLARAEARLREQQRKDDFDRQVAAINECIVRRDFTEASRLLRELSRQALDEAMKQKVRELRKIIFELEDGPAGSASSSTAQSAGNSFFDRASDDPQQSTQIAALEKQLDAAADACRYDDAIEACARLAQLDSTRRIKWEDRLSAFRAAKEKARKLKVTRSCLRDYIDEAKKEENWTAVEMHCRKFLELFDDENVRKTLARAETILREQKRRDNFDKMIHTINDCIIRRDFEEANRLVRRLLRRKLDAATEKKIENLRKLIHELQGRPVVFPASGTLSDEDSVPHGNPGRPVVRGFHTDEAPTKPEIGQGRTPTADPFDFYIPPARSPKRVSISARPEQRTSKREDGLADRKAAPKSGKQASDRQSKSPASSKPAPDFFDRADGSQPAKPRYTLDDFNF